MLAELVDLRGVSGDEGAVRRYIKDKLPRRGLDIRIDTMGNLLVRRKHSGSGAPGKGPRVMLAAHMDEVGLMVTAIGKNGMLKFKNVGGIDSRILVAKRVLVGAKALPGVIGAKPVHLQKEGEAQKPFDADALCIDIGCKSGEEAEKHVSVGDYVTFDSTCTKLSGDYYRGKAFDDRVGCLIILELLREEKYLNFEAAFTVQEEVGTRGAMVAAYSLEPQLALVLESTAASDTPETEKEAVGTRLGAGPAISLMDRTVFVDKELRAQLAEAAEKAKVPYQYRSFTGAGTDAGAIALSRAGVRTAVLSVPCRYLHSPHAVVKNSDIKAAASLVRAWLEMHRG